MYLTMHNSCCSFFTSFTAYAPYVISHTHQAVHVDILDTCRSHSSIL